MRVEHEGGAGSTSTSTSRISRLLISPSLPIHDRGFRTSAAAARRQPTAAASSRPPRLFAAAATSPISQPRRHQNLHAEATRAQDGQETPLRRVAGEAEIDAGDGGGEGAGHQRDEQADEGEVGDADEGVGGGAEEADGGEGAGGAEDWVGGKKDRSDWIRSG